MILSFGSEVYFWQTKNPGMIFLRWIHTIYAMILFGITFIIVFPIFLICAQNKHWHKFAYKVTYIWAWVYFFLVGIKVTIENQNETKWTKPCVYVANHFSYTDIASIPLIASDACFVGKQSITKAPLFGYYFRKLHITVNRSSIRDRAKVLENSGEALEDGKSLVIFPEGGIRSDNPPQQAPYKDGAFRIAINRGVPIVPITLAKNWKMFPDDGKFLLRGKSITIVIHKVIDTKDLNENDVPVIKKDVFKTIQAELDLKNQDLFS